MFEFVLESLNKIEKISETINDKAEKLSRIASLIHEAKYHFVFRVLFKQYLKPLTEAETTLLKAVNDTKDLEISFIKFCTTPEFKKFCEKTKQLEEENKDLKESLEIAYKAIYDFEPEKAKLTTEIERLQEQIEELKKENDALHTRRNKRTNKDEH